MQTASNPINPPRRRRLWLLLVPFLSGCGGLPVEDQAGIGPDFDLFQFFDGETQAWGIVQDWRGRVVRQFSASIEGHVNADELTLDERFIYGDGETDTRVWKIRRGATGQYSGSANDIVGQAQGRTHGNALRWRYSMDLETGGRTVRVQFDDRLWRVDGDTLINRAAIRKFGIKVAEVTLFMRRQSVQPGAS